ncbi:MAG: Aerobic glycerol-3-phosphate dehydrogenase [uncultured Sphingomonadaceae bacterium]|uniref:Glycerol-3-phosphate dehydrogenase n=1 Tax=uncultured Sphingomonadaceae bacterium TaxID=169976 RepID=A0A6J4T9F0_9SPHN|nr:MAG: Aerobic glycerol-3-phosphate dehydrogenase [uncultured Sphingomonadaceae bacterium]
MAEEAAGLDAQGPPGGVYDLLVIGGGINGAGIARDAAGRGLSVLLAERDDLASHTSSASTKLVHGGLRYLEYYELRLVRESLIERERLLSVAPHIVWPLQFVLPQPLDGRPRWLIRLGLLLYDNLGGRKRLPRSFGVRFPGSPFGRGLKPEVENGFVYSDCWIDDARMVSLNCMDAAARGATIRTRTRVEQVRATDGRWRARLVDTESGVDDDIFAHVVVNATGAQVGEVLGRAMDVPDTPQPRLVKGSHIVVPRLFDGPHAFILQNPDKRIVFAIPYEEDFTLIGTTDVPWSRKQGPARIDTAETSYLCESVNRYLARQIGPVDVVHSYSGVRPLFDDGREDASSVTRDYVLQVNQQGGAPILSVFGGKITTYRRLAEHALEKLEPWLRTGREAWTGTASLPGGDLPDGSLADYADAVRRRWPFLDDALGGRLARSYGTRTETVVGDAASLADLGEHFGGGLYAREVDYLVGHEWARTSEDILWRRSKLGLHLEPGSAAAIDDYLERRA